ncbi:MAG TPA: ribokinase [bacterium]
MKQEGIVVVGSANMDLVATTKTFPRPGETIFGKQFGMYAGGKGANQAVCCAKLGGRVDFIGKLGNDVFRDQLSSNMRDAGVNLQHLMSDPAASTGIALILVEESGENEIVVVSGSNMKLTPVDIERKRDVLAHSRVLLLQLEIPLECVVRSAEIAHSHGVTVILNPAPAAQLPDRLLSLVDYLTPNETELEIISGVPTSNRDGIGKAAAALLQMGVKNLIVTLGDQGCVWFQQNGFEAFPARPVKPVDTTAAGDAFNGAFAYSMSNSQSVPEAIGFANQVAAFSVTRMGAQSSMPTMEELQAFLQCVRESEF